jgi:hypothetical protein
MLVTMKRPGDRVPPMPLDLGNETARFVPGRCLVTEAGMVAAHLVRGTAGRGRLRGRLVCWGQGDVLDVAVHPVAGGRIADHGKAAAAQAHLEAGSHVGKVMLAV